MNKRMLGFMAIATVSLVLLGSFVSVQIKPQTSAVSQNSDYSVSSPPPWAYVGAYVNYSYVMINSTGTGSHKGFVYEKIISVDSANGSYEVIEKSNVAGIPSSNEYGNYSNSLSIFPAMNKTDIALLNNGTSISSSLAVKTSVKFTDSMGTFTTDKVFSGSGSTFYMDQKSGLIVGIYELYSGSALYANLTATNIPTTVTHSNSIFLYIALGAVAAVIVLIGVYVALSRKGRNEQK